MADIPALTVRLKKGEGKAALKGCPWVYAGELVESSEMALAEPGELAQLQTHKGEFAGIGTFNVRSQIALRLLTREQAAIDADFIHRRLSAALARREKSALSAYCRLVHAESDGLPGLIVDRFGDILVTQVTTAGMERLFPLVLDALEALLSPSAIVLRNDAPAREREGLSREARVLKGTVLENVEVHENGCIYFADLLYGQKTGWFYDQRDNRRLVAEHAVDRTVLDLYCHSGGFGLLASKQGGRSVMLVDSSKRALDLAALGVECNGLDGLCTPLQMDAFDAMETLAAQKRRFGVVVADPPAFVKSREHLASGLKGYEKVARLSAALVEEGGTLFIASCSHHVTRPHFREAVMRGVHQADRRGRVLSFTGAAADHPVHPHLPQSEYLKALLVRIT